MLMHQLLEERDTELERTEASLEGHKKGGQAREAVGPCPQDLLSACQDKTAPGPLATHLDLLRAASLHHLAPAS